MNSPLRPFWRPYFSFDWKLGLFLISIICIPRFYLVLQANQTANYGPIGAIMMVSALVPFVFIGRKGAAQIGVRKPSNWPALFMSFVSGLALALALYFIGDLLYSGTFQNWYVYVGQSYNIPDGISPEDKNVLFAVMAGTGMIFSPIGEELFFRGIVHGSFANSLGEKLASLIDSAAFALTHIAHFGLVYVAGGWNFYFLPTIIWVIAMFLVSLVFFQMKEKSGSILGAIICHAGFNLGMIYCIFYWL
ncbi:CPBP family intramembrane glutamic endopeptidase [Reichenbachiella ulvae]|uniref:CPBP family intramembrane metalloprotease n=1 Tax=Reichenbachiella ulvae TaxID=2980104 RepID=A0ABT3CYZ3_9BACT|nr:type II CAAX endopeptidase family protein [Reichenbachiella ulvae]MCV9388779.1 CPBP family intramembrane metalloprotease [Reichenbachiella ulvae]